ncbi:MAG: hypothetical protein AAF734_00880, partial [Bacteroidota bacterium]
MSRSSRSKQNIDVDASYYYSLSAYIPKGLGITRQQNKEDLNPPEGDKDDKIIAKIIDLANVEAFTEVQAKEIKRLYESEISDKKKDEFNAKRFNTILIGEEEKIPPSKDDKAKDLRLSVEQIENRKRAKALYDGYQVFKGNLPTIKEKLRVGIIWGLFNSVSAEEAIEAYKLLDQSGEAYVRLFYSEYPLLAERMDANLPVEFRTQQKTAFQKGFRRYEYSETNPLKPARDNRAALFSDIDKALAKEAKGENSGLDLLLAIAIEAGLEDTELQSKLRSATLSETKRQALEKKFPTVFGLAPLNQANPAQVEGGVTEGQENSLPLGAIGGGDLLRFGGGLLTKKLTLKDVDLIKAQKYGAGTLGGMAFEQDESHSRKSYKTWLRENQVAEGTSADTTLDELDNAEITFELDLQRKRKRDKDKESYAKVFAIALPFGSLNYLAGDMAVRGENGVLKHLYAHLSWDAVERSGERDLSKPVAVKALLEEVTFHNLRIIFNNETYGIGKLQLNNISLTATQVLENAGKVLTVVKDELLPFFTNLSMVATAVVQKAIAGMQGFDAVKAASEGLEKVLASGPNDLTSVHLNVGDILIENFYSTSMGMIGKLALGATEVDITSQRSGELLATEMMGEYLPGITGEDLKNTPSPQQARLRAKQAEVA